MAKPDKNNGDDSLLGGNDHDLLSGGNGDDTILGGWGDDIIHGGNGNDSIIGGRISLFTFDDDNLLDGGNGDDSLVGFLGDDTLLGGNGQDLLVGAGGANLLTGGNGNDVFQFGFGAPLVPLTLIGNDVITDFGNGNDIIDLRNLNAANIAYGFIGQEEFSGTKPEVRYRWVGDTTVIEMDSQFFGFSLVDGVVDGTITLLGRIALDAEKFYL